MSLENIISYTFQNPELLRQALTHPSISRRAYAFERLEFLGDRVLGMVAAEWVYKEFPKESEGDLTKRFSSLVSRESCLKVAKDINLSSYMKIYAHSSETHIVSDGVEALIGAIYLDSGFEPCRLFIQKFWKSILESNKKPPKDAKSSLQEWAQSHNMELPEYTLLRIEGLAHAPTFVVEISMKGFPTEQALASTKRLAEQKAALKIIDHIKNKKKKSKTLSSPSSF